MLDTDATTDLADQFPILAHMDFFNHAGVAPISGPAAAALEHYARQASQSAYVDSGWYRRAREVKRLAASLIGAAGEEEIAFTPNTSTGLSLVAKGIDWQRGDQVVITNVEYPANRYPWEDLKRLGVELIEVQQRTDGRIYIEDVTAVITGKTRIVALSHVQYASGHRINLKPISDAVHQVGGLLCVDAIQSCGAIPMDVEVMGIDFLSADGHKWMLASEGLGIFYCRRELAGRLHPNVVGWMNMVDASNYGDYQFEFQPDARRFEPGSYNIPGILALGASLDMLLAVGSDEIWARIDLLTTRLCDGLQAKGYRIFSPRDQPDERSGIVIFEAPPPSPSSAGRDRPSLPNLVADLEKQNIIIVVREGRLRASPHFYNTVQQIDRLLAALP